MPFIYKGFLYFIRRFHLNVPCVKIIPMKEFTSCKQATESCMQTGTFAVAHLYKEEKTMDMHIHDCCEIYFSISGGKQFLIDNRFYTIAPGDVFAINQYESHYLTQIDSMVRQIERFEYIVTDSELEALILENNLIKEHRPKYNTMLKDDKTYPYIKVTAGEPFPRIIKGTRSSLHALTVKVSSSTVLTVTKTSASPPILKVVCAFIGSAVLYATLCSFNMLSRFVIVISDLVGG